MKRRDFVKAGIAGAAAGCVPGVFAQGKAEFTYKYANNLPITHPMNIRAREMAEAISKETRGRVEIQIFPSNQLGGDTDMLSQIRTGGIQRKRANRGRRFKGSSVYTAHSRKHTNS